MASNSELVQRIEALEATVKELSARVQQLEGKPSSGSASKTVRPAAPAAAASASATARPTTAAPAAAPTAAKLRPQTAPPAAARPATGAKQEKRTAASMTLRGAVILTPAPSAFTPSSTDGAASSEELAIEYVFGYQGKKGRANLFHLPTGEVVYFIAGLGVLLNPSTNKQRFYRAHDNDIKSLAVHSTEHVVATGQVAGPTTKPHIRVWNYDTLETVSTLGLNGSIERAVACVAFSAHAPNLLGAVDEGNQRVFSLWDWRAGTLLMESKGSSEPVLLLESCPSNGWFVSGGEKHVHFWDIKATGSKYAATKMQGQFLTFKRPKAVLSCTFTSEGNAITGDSDGSVFLWSAPGQFADGMKVIKNIDLAHDAVYSVVIVGDTLVSGGRDGAIKFWGLDLQPKSGREAITVGEGVRCIAPAGGSLDAIFVGTTNNGIVSVTGKTTKPLLQGHNGELWALAVHPSEPLFFTAAYDGTVSAWSAVTHQQVWKATLGTGVEGQSAHVNQAKGLLAIGCNNGTVQLFDLKGALIKSVNVSKKAVGVVKFSPDGSKFAAGCHDMVVHVHSSEGDFASLASGKGHSASVNQIDWSEDGNFAQSASIDYEVLYWDTSNWARIGNASDVRDVQWATQSLTLGWSVQGMWPKGADGTDINAVDRSHSKQLLASADDFSLVKLFKFPCYVEHSKAHTYTAHSAHVTNVRFLADDSRVISIGGQDNAVIVWAVTQSSG
eukprot:m.305316 g.305316  ORF g.305316 m.305316 type:complete len:725 (+) comp55287_c0_seq1:96-2270(+)